MVVETPRSDFGFIHMLDSVLFELLHTLVADHGSLALPMLLSFFVSNEKLALLAVALWFVLCDLDHGEDTMALPEDTIHLLQGAVGGLWIEKPDRGNDGSVTVTCV